jgi:predicted nucleic acid-binding protein
LTAEHLTAGLLLWQRHEQLSSLDAILAASCINAGATLVSADKAFARVRDLDHVVPDARGVKRLIAG